MGTQLIALAALCAGIGMVIARFTLRTPRPAAGATKANADSADKKRKADTKRKAAGAAGPGGKSGGAAATNAKNGAAVAGEAGQGAGSGKGGQDVAAGPAKDQSSSDDAPPAKDPR